MKIQKTTNAIIAAGRPVGRAIIALAAAGAVLCRADSPSAASQADLIIRSYADLAKVLPPDEARRVAIWMATQTMIEGIRPATVPQEPPVAKPHPVLPEPAISPTPAEPEPNVLVERLQSLMKTDSVDPVIPIVARELAIKSKLPIPTSTNEMPKSWLNKRDKSEQIAAREGERLNLPADEQAALVDAVGKVSDQLEAKSDVTDFPRSLFHSGVMALSPYKTKGPASGNAVPLDQGNAAVKGYIEFQYNNEWAFNSNSRDEDTSMPNVQKEGDHSLRDIVSPWRLLPKENVWDFAIHTGFTFGDGSSSNPTNAEASTIAGSGDFYINTSTGRQLVRYGNEQWRFTFSPEVSGGMSTDLGNFEVHPSVLAGLKWSIGFKPPTSWGDNQAALLMRVGYGWMDVPSLTTTVVNGQAVTAVAVENGRLKYNSLCGGPAMETQLFYPLGKGTMLTVGGRIMSQGDADQWTFRLGLVKSLDSLAGFFGFGGGPETSGDTGKK